MSEQGLPVSLVGMALHRIKQRDRLHGEPCYCENDAADLRRWHDSESLPDDRHSIIEGAGRAVQDDGLPTLVRELADALEGLTPFVRVGDGPLGDDPAAIAMRRAFDALGEAKPLRAAPPLHDPQEPERG